MKESSNKFLKIFLESQTYVLFAILVIIIFYTLYFIKAIAIPVVIAILLNFLLMPIVKFFKKKLSIPAQISAPVVILIFLIVVGNIFYGISQPAAAWLSQMPKALNTLEDKLQPLKRVLAKPILAFSKIDEKMFTISAKVPQQAETTIKVKQSSNLVPIFVISSQLLIEIGITIFMLYFLLVYNNFLLKKLLNWPSKLKTKKELVKIVRRAERKIGEYLFIFTIINIGFAIIVSLLMYVLGMPNPILWGCMAGILEYIPYLGALIMTLIITLVSLLSFNHLGYAFLVPGIYILVVAIHGNIVSPSIMGKAFILNPTIVFLSILLWGFIWGISGVFLAVPMVITAKIILEKFYKTSFLHQLLQH